MRAWTHTVLLAEHHSKRYVPQTFWMRDVEHIERCDRCGKWAWLDDSTTAQRTTRLGDDTLRVETTLLCSTCSEDFEEWTEGYRMVEGADDE